MHRFVSTRRNAELLLPRGRMISVFGPYKELIERIHEELFRGYGYRRMKRELKRRGL